MSVATRALYSNVPNIFSRVSRVAVARPRCLSTLPSPRRLPSLPRPTRHFSTSPRVSAQHFVEFGGSKGNPRSDRQFYIAGALVVFGGIYYVVHLEQVPETGRWRFMDVSAKREARLGQQMYNATMQEYGPKILPPSHPVSQHVTAVVRRILQSSGLGHIRGELARVDGTINQGLSHPDERLNFDVGTRSDGSSGKAQQKEWTVHVVQDDEPNAEAAIGGHIIVYTGILPICRDEDGLATILGHEIAHVVARHAAEHLSFGKVLTVLVGVIELVGLAPGTLTPLVANLLLSLPNSRKQEYEADRIGLKLMARACFDPRAAPATFARLAEYERQHGLDAAGRLLQFFLTHPLTSKRVQMLEGLLPEAFSAQAENGLCGDTAQQLHVFARAFGDIARPSAPPPPRPPSLPRPLPPPPTSSGGWKSGDGSEFLPETPEKGEAGEIIWK